MRMISILILFIFVVLVGCTNYHSGTQEERILSSERSANDYLTENEDADILQINGVIFYNVEHTNQVKEGVLSLGELVGEVKKQTKESRDFENGTATKLPVGTKIYIAEGTLSENSVEIYLAVVDGKLIPYLYRIEG